MPYRYVAPPEIPLADEYTQIAVTLEPAGFDTDFTRVRSEPDVGAGEARPPRVRSASAFRLPIPNGEVVVDAIGGSVSGSVERGRDRTPVRLRQDAFGPLTQSGDVATAHIVVDLTVDPTTMEDLQVVAGSEVVNGQPRETWQATGVLTTPFRIEIFDRPGNAYLFRQAFFCRDDADLRHNPVTGTLLFSEAEARLALAVYGTRTVRPQRQRADTNAQQFARDILNRLFADHEVDTTFSVPVEDSRVPQFALAWRALISGHDVVHAQRALAIYRSIPPEQFVDKKGREVTALVYAATVGEAVAAYLAGEIDAAHDLVRKAGLIDPKARRAVNLGRLVSGSG